MKVRSHLTMASLALAASAPAYALEGTYPNGYGVKAQGMGGVGIALPQDAVAAAYNPAGMALIGSRQDVGLNVYRAKPQFSIVPAGFDAEATVYPVVPDGGISFRINDNWSAGLSAYGHGVGQDYKKPIGPPSNSNSDSGLTELILAPTAAYRITADQAVGISLNVGYHRFKASGLQAQTGGALQDPGTNSSWGTGVAVGWNGKLTPDITFGAVYSSKIKMGKLEKYSVLLANQGQLDIPASFGAGAAWRASDQTTVAVDLLRIQWSKVDAYGLSVPSGFGWHDQSVVKVGVSQKLDARWTLRAGYSQATEQIPSDQTLLAFLAPSTVNKHASLGASLQWTKDLDFSVAYTHGFSKKIRGTGPSAGYDVRNVLDTIGLGIGVAF